LAYVRAAFREFLPNLRDAVRQLWISQEDGERTLIGRAILLACAFLMLLAIFTSARRALGGDLKSLLSFVEIAIFLPVGLKAFIAWMAKEDAQKPNGED
ncbi:MAG TPA: hypothetical protein VJM31_01295, partial [Vicinamibacterales bacterium]|nr:hypothetical protein [Vicinamibacterales bacterium]